MGSLYEMLRSSSVFQDKIEKLCLDNVAALVLQEVIISSVQREEQFDNYEHHRLYFCFQFSSFTWNFFEWCPNEQLEYSVTNVKTLVLTVINLETYKGFVKEPIMHYLSTCGPPHLICFIFVCEFQIYNFSLWMYQLEFMCNLNSCQLEFTRSLYTHTWRHCHLGSWVENLSSVMFLHYIKYISWHLSNKNTSFISIFKDSSDGSVEGSYFFYD